MLNAAWFLTGLIVGVVFIFIMAEYRVRHAYRRAAFTHKLSLIRSHAVTLPPDSRDMVELVRLERLSDDVRAKQFMFSVFGGAVRGI